MIQFRELLRTLKTLTIPGRNRELLPACRAGWKRTARANRGTHRNACACASRPVAVWPFPWLRSPLAWDVRVRKWSSRASCSDITRQVPVPTRRPRTPKLGGSGLEEGTATPGWGASGSQVSGTGGTWSRAFQPEPTLVQMLDSAPQNLLSDSLEVFKLLNVMLPGHSGVRAMGPQRQWLVMGIGFWKGRQQKDLIIFYFKRAKFKMIKSWCVEFEQTNKAYYVSDYIPSCAYQ